MAFATAFANESANETPEADLAHCRWIGGAVSLVWWAGGPGQAEFTH